MYLCTQKSAADGGERTCGALFLQVKFRLMKMRPALPNDNNNENENEERRHDQAGTDTLLALVAPIQGQHKTEMNG